MKVRLDILGKISNSSRGSEDIISTIAARAFLGSLLESGLTVTGSAADGEDFEKVDTRVMNRVARRVAGGRFFAEERFFALWQMFDQQIITTC